MFKDCILENTRWHYDIYYHVYQGKKEFKDCIPEYTRWHYDIYYHVYQKKRCSKTTSLKIQGDIMIFIIMSIRERLQRVHPWKYTVTLYDNHVNQKMKFEDFNSKIQGDIMIFIIMSIKNLSSMTIYIPEIQGDSMTFLSKNAVQRWYL